MKENIHALKMIGCTIGCTVGGWFALTNVIYPVLHYIAPSVFQYS